MNLLLTGRQGVSFSPLINRRESQLPFRSAN
jgi:hypothetical protein